MPSNSDFKIEVDDQKVRMIGDKATLANVVAGRQTPAGNARGFVCKWRAVTNEETNSYTIEFRRENTRLKIF